MDHDVDSLGDPYEALLNRHLAPRAVEEHLAKPLCTLRDAVDYGTNLIPRCWHDSDQALTDVVILLALTRQAVTLLDAGHVLLRQLCCHPAHLQLRAVFEVSVYIQWILSGEEAERATAFYVGDLRRKRRACLRAVPGSKEHQAYLDGLKDLDMPAILEKWEERAKAELASLDEHLEEGRFAELNRRFEERVKPGYEERWYKVLGVKNFRKLAESVGRLGAYTLIYESGSQVMHSSSMKPHVRLETDGSRVLPIRDPETFGFVLPRLLGEAANLYRVVLDRYRPGELSNLRRKYISDWRDVHVGEINVKLVDPPDSVEP